MTIAYAARKLAEHLRVAGLAGGGGMYLLTTTQQGSADASMLGAILAITVWATAVLMALAIDCFFGEE